MHVIRLLLTVQKQIVVEQYRHDCEGFVALVRMVGVVSFVSVVSIVSLVEL